MELGFHGMKYMVKPPFLIKIIFEPISSMKTASEFALWFLDLIFNLIYTQTMTIESAFHVKRSTQWNIFGDFATEAIERERYGFENKNYFHEFKIYVINDYYYIV